MDFPIPTTGYSEYFQQELLDKVLLAHVPVGTPRADIDVLVLTETDLTTPNGCHTDAYLRVAAVAQQLIVQARQYVDAEYIQAIEVARAACLQDSPNLSDDALVAAVHRDAHVQFWRAAQMRLNGDDLNVDDWKFLFVGGNASPNACATPAAPTS